MNVSQNRISFDSSQILLLTEGTVKKDCIKGSRYKKLKIFGKEYKDGNKIYS